MIFPSKHLRLNNALLNLGAIILKSMKKNQSYYVDDIWKTVKDQTNAKQFTFNDLILTFDFLFLLDAIFVNDEGKLCLN